jgi:hypothetical protein
VRLGWSASDYPVDANVSRIAAALETPKRAAP